MQYDGIENLISLYCMMALKPELEKLRLNNNVTELKDQDYLFLVSTTQKSVVFTQTREHHSQ